MAQSWLGWVCRAARAGPATGSVSALSQDAVQGVGWAGVEPGSQQLDEQDVHDAVEDGGGPRLGLAAMLTSPPWLSAQ